MTSESSPLLGRSELAEAVRRTALVYMLCSSYLFGSFLALREEYTSKILDASDPVGTATMGLVCYYGAHAFSSPIFGKLSDGTGRKPILLLGITVACLFYAGLALSSSTWVFVAAFGVLGLLDSGYTMVYLMLVDTSNEPLSPGVLGWAAHWAGVAKADAELNGDQPVERRIGLLFSVCWGIGLLGTVFGVVCAFVLTSLLGVRATLAVGSGLAALVAVRVAYALPETVGGPSDASLVDLVRAALAEQWAGAAALLDTSRRATLLAISFLQHASAASSFSLLAYWVVFKFGFGIGLQAVGTLVAIFSVATGLVFVQVVFVPSFQGREGDDSRRPAELGCVVLVLLALPFWALLGLAFEPWMALLGCVATASAAIFPELRALVTADLPTKLQGFVQGALATVNSLADIFGAGLGVFLYEAAVDDDIPHDSHRSRTSYRANAIWHFLFFVQIVVALLTYYLPQPSASSSLATAKAEPVKNPDKDDELLE